MKKTSHRKNKIREAKKSLILILNKTYWKRSQFFTKILYKVDETNNTINTHIDCQNIEQKIIKYNIEYYKKRIKVKYTKIKFTINYKKIEFVLKS